MLFFCFFFFFTVEDHVESLVQFRLIFVCIPFASDDSSDDDKPLIKMIKKAPTDEQLKETVESLLKKANLEEMTMKQICQKVTLHPWVH